MFCVIIGHIYIRLLLVYRATYYFILNNYKNMTYGIALSDPEFAVEKSVVWRDVNNRFTVIPGL